MKDEIKMCVQDWFQERSLSQDYCTDVACIEKLYLIQI